MTKLKKLLSATSKSRRHRRNILNILITVLAWFVEFLGFTTVFLGTHILGHQDNITNLTLQTLTNILYFIAVPSVLLINDFDLKTKITESFWYSSLLGFFNWSYDEQDEKDDAEQSEIPRLDVEQNIQEVNSMVVELGSLQDDEGDSTVTTNYSTLVMVKPCNNNFQ